MGSLSSHVIDKVHLNSEINWKNEFDSVSSGDNPAQLMLETKTFMEKNPGGFDDLQRTLRDLTTSPFEGLKFVSNIPINENFQTSLNWIYGSDANSKFYPALNFSGNKKIRAFENSPMGIIEFDSIKNFGFNFIYYLNKQIRLKYQLQSKDGSFESDCNATYYGNTYTISSSILSPSFFTKSGFLSVQLLKRLSQTIDIGGEVAIQLMNGGMQCILPSFALRYFHGVNPDQMDNSNGLLPSFTIEPKGTFLSVISPKAIHLSYHRHAGPGLQLLTTCDFSPEFLFPPVSSVGYTYKVSKIDLSIKSSFDTTKTVQTVIEKHFGQNEDFWSISLSAAHNFPSNRTITGIGLTLGK